MLHLPPLEAASRKREKPKRQHTQWNAVTFPSASPGKASLLLATTRGALAIPLFAAILGSHAGLGLVLLSLAAATDFLDGFLARRHASWSASALDAYADPVADMMIVLAGFIALFLRGISPPWIVPLLFISFLQFVLTSPRRAPLYDPIGKYLGFGLLLILAVVLLFPGVSSSAWVCTAAVVVLSTVGRGVYLLRRRQTEG
jgi:phosphatidylglycerophosphate synthase